MSKRLRYLLDTNMISDLIRSPTGAVKEKIERTGEDTICTSIIVAAELRYGGVKSGSKRLAEQIEMLLSALTVLPLEAPVDQHYAHLRQHLARQGTPIGPNDLLIAAHALTAQLTVVTANMGEFARVPGLAVENWLQD